MRAASRTNRPRWRCAGQPAHLFPLQGPRRPRPSIEGRRRAARRARGARCALICSAVRPPAGGRRARGLTGVICGALELLHPLGQRQRPLLGPFPGAQLLLEGGDLPQRILCHSFQRLRHCAHGLGVLGQKFLAQWLGRHFPPSDRNFHHSTHCSRIPLVGVTDVPSVQYLEGSSVVQFLRPGSRARTPATWQAYLMSLLICDEKLATNGPGLFSLPVNFGGRPPAFGVDHRRRGPRPLQTKRDGAEQRPLRATPSAVECEGARYVR